MKSNNNSRVSNRSFWLGIFFIIFSYTLQAQFLAFPVAPDSIVRVSHFGPRDVKYGSKYKDNMTIHFIGSTEVRSPLDGAITVSYLNQDFRSIEIVNSDLDIQITLTGKFVTESTSEITVKRHDLVGILLPQYTDKNVLSIKIVVNGAPVNPIEFFSFLSFL